MKTKEICIISKVVKGLFQQSTFLPKQLTDKKQQIFVLKFHLDT